jgi:glucosamine 6-phosphate synthetase-like amidotransferase/phosphosugar isomerase protein
MCGIVGMVVKPNNGFSVKTENVFNQLLYADAVRGEDSTGA